ncbi:hypothetical protein TrRE_jg11254, partial [Triparma retinervis]
TNLIDFGHYLQATYEDRNGAWNGPISQGNPPSSTPPPSNPPPNNPRTNRKRKKPSNPYTKRTTNPKTPRNPYAKKPPNDNTRNARAKAKESREKDQKKKEQEERNRAREANNSRNADEAKKRDEETQRNAKDATTQQAKENARRDKRDKDLKFNAATRSRRLTSAFDRHSQDVKTQKEHYDRRATNPTIPPTPEKYSPSTRYPKIPARKTPAERAAKEANRAAEITQRMRTASRALEEAETPEAKADAHKLIDAATADERRHPAHPYTTTESLNPYAIEAFDNLHPLDIASNYLNIPRRPPENLMAQLASIIGHAGIRRREAKSLGDTAGEDRWLKVVLVAPTLFLRHQSVSSPTPQQRIGMFYDNKFGELIADLTLDIEAAESKALDGILPNSEDTNTSNILRLISQGEYALAAARLESNVILDTGRTEVAAQLRERLGQPRLRELPGACCDDGKPFKRIEINVKKTFRRLKPNKGTGPNQVSSELLTSLSLDRPTTEGANDATDIAMHDLAHEYLNGSAPLWYYALDAHAEVMALSKSVTKINARPISMCSTITRAFKAAAVGKAYENAEETFAECQFGAGQKSGGHSQSIGATLLLESLPNTGGLILLDVENAYSSTDRALALEKVRKHPNTDIRSLYPVILSTYSPNGVAKGIDLEIQTGVAQGDPLSSILFAVAIHDSILELRAATQDSAISYQDDTVCPAQDLRKTLPHISKFATSLFNDTGLRLNPTKCTVVSKDPDNARKTKMSHLMATVRPTIIEPYLERLQSLILTHVKNLLSLDTTMEHITEDEQVVVLERLGLPIKQGGLGLTPLKDIARAAFVAALTQAIPRFSDRVIDNIHLKAAIPELSQLIGSDMGDANTHNRLAQFTSEEAMSKSITATAFFIAYAHLQEQNSTGIYDIRTKPERTPETGFLNAPIEGLGRDRDNPAALVTTRLQQKLYAPISNTYVDATNDFSHNNLPRESKVREALIYTNASRSSKAFLWANPSRQGAFSNADFITATNSYFGLPIPLCLANIGVRLSSNGKSLDAYGDNLANTTTITGPSNKTRHDNTLQVLADLAREAGSNFTIEDTTTFASARDPNSDSLLPPIIPDITIMSSNNKKIYDLKIVGTGTSGFRTGTEGTAIERRAEKVSTEYANKARKNDESRGDSATTKILQGLGGVTGLACGPRGE